MLRRVVLAVTLVLGALVLTPLSASATCAVINPRTGQCQVEIEVPGGGGGGGGGDWVSTGPGKCYAQDGREVPCSVVGMPWLGDCWGHQIDPAILPEEVRAPYEGQEGTWYRCLGGVLEVPRFVPGGTPMPPNPRDLAERALASMELKAASIGIVPKNEPGKVGIVGMPVWMWATNTDQVGGERTASASVGPFSVSVTARLASVVWDMGDGRTVTCSGDNAVGTPYQASYGKADSPTCGHRYSAVGDYTVTATSHWEIEWAGIGQTGTMSMELSDSTQISIGEVQVLTESSGR